MAVGKRSQLKIVEKQEGFDRAAVEAVVESFFERKTGDTPAILDSAQPGVIAIERPDVLGKPFHWDELAAEIARETGSRVECIANCEWTRDDGPDEEAVYIACTIPSLNPGYGYADNMWRNMIGPVSRETAPSAEQFAARDEAMTFVRGHCKELRARREYLSGGEADANEHRISFLENVLHDGLDAGQVEIVARLCARDVDGAIAVARDEEPSLVPSSDAPRMG
jgi:hypothetical protein